MTSTELKLRFDLIVNHSISIEESNYAMHKYWQDFLVAGFDATKIAEKLSPEDVWLHYDELVAHGAKIDLTKFPQFFNENFIKEHWDELAKRGVESDILADKCYHACDVTSISDLESLLAKGVSVKQAFILIKSWLKIREEWPREQEEILTWLYDHDLPKVYIKNWLEDYTGCIMEEYVVESGSDIFKKFDIDDAGLIDRWLSYNGYRYFSKEKLSDLPATISVEKFMNFYPMRDIVLNCSPYGFGNFIEDYLNHGNIDDLAQRFIDEIGYSNEVFNSEFMLELILAGASVINPEKFIASIDLERLDKDSAKAWHNDLLSIGYDKELISVLI